MAKHKSNNNTPDAVGIIGVTIIIIGLVTLWSKACSPISVEAQAVKHTIMEAIKHCFIVIGCIIGIFVLAGLISVIYDAIKTRHQRKLLAKELNLDDTTNDNEITPQTSETPINFEHEISIFNLKREIGALKTENMLLQYQLKTLSQQPSNDALQAQIRTLQTKLENTTEQLQLNIQALAESDSIRLSLENDNNKLRNQLSQQSRAVRAKQQNTEELFNNNDKLFNELNAQIRTLKTKLKSTEEQLRLKAQSLTESRNQCSVLDRDNNKLRHEIATYKKKIDELTVTIEKSNNNSFDKLSADEKKVITKMRTAKGKRNNTAPPSIQPPKPSPSQSNAITTKKEKTENFLFPNGNWNTFTLPQSVTCNSNIFKITCTINTPIQTIQQYIFFVLDSHNNIVSNSPCITFNEATGNNFSVTLRLQNAPTGTLKLCCANQESPHTILANTTLENKSVFKSII